MPQQVTENARSAHRDISRLGRRLVTRQDLHQGALAAVFPQYTVDLACLKDEADSIIRLDIPEVFADFFELDFHLARSPGR
jgi:hypothetical protein